MLGLNTTPRAVLVCPGVLQALSDEKKGPNAYPQEMNA